MLNKFKSIFSKVFKTDSLKSRVAKGSVSLGIGTGVEQFLRLVRNMIFARIILPEEMGIFVIVLAIYSLFESIAEVGIREAIIQNPDSEDPHFLNAAWFFAAIRGVLLYAVGFFTSPLIAYFYNDPSLVPLLRVTFIYMIFFGFISSRAYIALKKMEMHKWVLIEQLGGIIGIVTASVLVIIYKNIWALIIGFVLEGFARCVLSFIFCPFLPRFKFNRKYLKEIFRFSRGMLGTPLLSYIYLKADVFVIGKLLDKEALGLYGWAANLAKLPMLLFQKIINPLIIPAFSEIQNDLERTNRTLLKITRIFALIALPLIVFFIFYSKEVLSIVYTPQYAAVAIPFAILLTAIILRNFNVPIVGIYLAMGKPAYVRAFTLIRALLVVGLIVPATIYFGLLGTSVVVLVSMVISYFVQLIVLRKITEMKLKSYFKCFFPYVFFTIPLFIAKLITISFFSENQWLSLLVSVLALSVVYLGSVLYFLRNNKIKLPSQLQKS